MKKILPVAVVVLVAVAAIMFAVSRHASRRTDAIRLAGNIETTEVDVSFRVPGVVTVRPADEGNTLALNDLVAALDDTELKQEVAIRRADAAAAGERLNELRAGYRVEEIAKARASVDLANAEAERASADVVRLRDLYENGVAAKRDLDVAVAGDKTARARVREAETQLSLFTRGYRAEQIAQASAAHDAATEALAAAETRLTYANLRAPLGGVVLTKNVEPGEHVAAGTPVVTIAQLSSVWLRTYVDERDLGRIKLGQHVRVTTDSLPGKNFDGRIAFIASESEFTPKTVQTDKERVKLVYRVKIDIPNPRFELKPGMPADAWVPVP